MADTTKQDHVAQLQQQAADDYARAQAARDWQTNRDDANIRQPGKAA
ncbi:hypothetical protein [Streptomyces zaomyceticus]